MNNNTTPFLKEKRINILFFHLLVCITFLFIVEALELKRVYLLMSIFSIWNILVLLLLLKHELKYSNGFNFFMFYFVGCILRAALPGLTLSLEALQGNNITYLDAVDVQDYIFPTLIWMNISYILFLWGFISITKNKIETFNVELIFTKFNFLKLAIIIYIVTYVVSFLNIFNFSSTINALVAQLRFSSLFFLMFNAVYNKSRKNLNVFLLLVAIELGKAILGGFFKSGLITPFLLLMMYIVLKQKKEKGTFITPKMIFTLLFIFCFTIFFVYPFMNTKRNLSGFDARVGKATAQYSNIEILNTVLNGESENNFSESNNIEALFRRMSAIVPNAFFLKDVSEKEKYIPDFTTNTIFLYIPRFLYPNKPNNEVGLMVTSYVRTGRMDLSFRKSENSYNYVGFFASKYIVGGILVVFVFSILNGLIIGLLYNYTNKFIYNPFSMMVLFFMIFQSLYAFEEVHDPILGILMPTIIYYFLIRFSNKYFRKIITT